MNKKAGTTIILKTIIGLVIAIIVIVVLLNVMDKFLLFGKDEPNQQIDFFNKLNDEIKELNGETTQIFQLEENYLLIAFNSKNNKVVTTTIKKPPQYENSLCLCKTKDDKYLFTEDCLQSEDICIEQNKEITNNNKPFFLFGEGIYNLKLEKISNKINITF